MYGIVCTFLKKECIQHVFKIGYTTQSIEIFALKKMTSGFRAAPPPPLSKTSRLKAWAFFIFYHMRLAKITRMKRKAFVVSVMILCCWACCGFFCTSQWDLYQSCGLIIDIEPPENSDSVHISVYNDGTIYHLFRDKVIHPKSNPADSFRSLSEAEHEDDLKDSDWEYGKFFMAETVFCGDKKTIFPVVSFNVRKGRTSARIETFYATKRNYYDSSTGTMSTLHEHFDYDSSLPPNYDFASIDEDSTYYIEQRFVPIVNDCGIDSTYLIEIDYTKECHKESDNAPQWPF